MGCAVITSTTGQVSILAIRTFHTCFSFSVVPHIGHVGVNITYVQRTVLAFIGHVVPKVSRVFTVITGTVSTVDSVIVSTFTTGCAV